MRRPTGVYPSAAITQAVLAAANTSSPETSGVVRAKLFPRVVEEFPFVNSGGDGYTGLIACITETAAIGKGVKCVAEPLSPPP